MTIKINETKAKQGRDGIRVAVIVIASMLALGFVGWIAMFSTAS